MANLPFHLYDIGPDVFHVVERTHRAESEARRLGFFLQVELDLWLEAQDDRDQAFTWLASQPWAMRGILIPEGILENLRNPSHA